MGQKEVIKLTATQREVLEALRDGGMITIDEMNMPWLGDRSLGPGTRYFLTENRLVTRADKARSVESRGNGYVISQKGLALLNSLRERRKGNTPVQSKQPPVRGPEPPTERQLAFAKELGLSLPNEATKDEVSDLISIRVDNDKPAGENHKRIASLFGVQFTRFTGKKRLYLQIHMAVSRPTHELDLATWFTYRVYRNLVRGAQDASIKGPDDPIIKEIASQLVSDESAFRSIRRYRPDDLLFFGEWTSPKGDLYFGGSKRTASYEKASALLKEKLGLS